MRTRRYTSGPPRVTSKLLVPHVVEVHAGDAAFLWLMRRKAAHSVRYALADLARADERVDAHLEGLDVAGSEGWLQLGEGLAEAHPGAVFAACVWALRRNDAERCAEALDIAGDDDACLEAAISAFGWVAGGGSEGPPLEPAWSVRWADTLLATGGAARRAVAVGALTVAGVRPSDAMLELLQRDDSPVLSSMRVARMIGELGLVDQQAALARWLEHHDAAVRFVAAWSMLRLRAAHSSLHKTVREALRAPEPESATLELAARELPAGQLNEWWIELLARNKPRAAIKLIAAGGFSNHVDKLIELMAADKRTARLAGWAFTQITGCDLIRSNFEADSEPASELLDDENVEVDGDSEALEIAEDQLPQPRPDAVAAWWSEQRGGFSTDARYLAGKPIHEPSLKNTLASGVQPQRRAAAIELACTRPDTVLYNVSQPGFAQARVLLGWR